jgi:glucose/arabinose dehydrogenase
VAVTFRCLLAAAAVAAASTSLAEVVDVQPFATLPGKGSSITSARDGSGRLFVTTLNGLVLILNGNQVLPTPFLDLTPIFENMPGAQLLSVAFHPQYAANGRFFVFYVTFSGISVVAYQVSQDPNRADPASGQPILNLSVVTGGQSGGQLAFGPDGNLYVAIGDDEISANGQDLTSLHGKLLRIDVDHGSPYTIPPGNPFASNPDPSIRKEIWDYGFRNPWRFSFDRATGDLFIGDVGEGRIEEVDFEPAGAPGGRNYGWSIMEGSLCHDPPVGCNTAGLTLPIIEIPHSPDIVAVIGGYRYRGNGIPALQGIYVFGDYAGGVYAARQAGDGTWSSFKLGSLPNFGLQTLGEDEAGELYAADELQALYRIAGGGEMRLSIADAVVGEGETSVAFDVEASGANLTSPVTVQYATSDGEAVAPGDYTATAGTLTLEPFTSSAQIVVPIHEDEVYEGSEFFLVTLSNPSPGAVLADAQASGTIVDDDPQPDVSIFGCSVVEGPPNTSSACVFSALLDRLSNFPVGVTWVPQPGTATPNVDYLAVGGTINIPPGATEASGTLLVHGDSQAEPDEYVNLAVTSVQGAHLAQGSARAWILDDDGAALSHAELVHGSSRSGSLTTGDDAWYSLAQQPLRSYEVTVDGVAGDVGDGLILERIAGDGSVLQSAGAAPTLSLRFENAIPGVVVESQIRIRRTGCAPCAAASYRVRLRETTAEIGRFNNSATQVTLVALVNPGDAVVTGTLRLWSALGELLWEQPVSLSGKAVGSWNTDVWAPTATGSITFAHDAPYGLVTGKTTALEAATGFVFETVLSHKPI